LDDQTIDRAVGETVRRLRGSLRQKRKRARVAVDATGLAQGAGSTFFVRRMHHHGQKPLPWRHWLKWVVAVDLDQQFVLSQLARRGPWNDCANLPAVVEAASQQTRIGLVLADAEFDSERNHTYIRNRLGAQSVIPAKRGKKTWRVHGVRAEMRRAFPQRLYRRRSLIESLFSSVKRKLSARAPGRSLRTQMRDALLADKNEEAARWLRDAAKLQPKESSYWFDLGIAYHRMGNMPAAMAAYQRAHELDPNNQTYSQAAENKH